MNDMQVHEMSRTLCVSALARIDGVAAVYIPLLSSASTSSLVHHLQLTMQHWILVAEDTAKQHDSWAWKAIFCQLFSVVLDAVGPLCSPLNVLSSSLPAIGAYLPTFIVKN